jgi:drug/metabolite transporter (DMT)-like permease
MVPGPAPGLATTRAAIVQLFVPVLTAFGGVVFLAEQVSLRLVVARILILGGVMTALATHPSEANPAVSE